MLAYLRPESCWKTNRPGIEYLPLSAETDYYLEKTLPARVQPVVSGCTEE